MNLRDRIDNPDRRHGDATPHEDQRARPERRVPEWVKRAQENRLPNSDRTGQVAA